MIHLFVTFHAPFTHFVFDATQKLSIELGTQGNKLLFNSIRFHLHKTAAMAKNFNYGM